MAKLIKKIDCCCGSLYEQVTGPKKKLDRLEYFEAGNTTNPEAQTLVLLAGWPDTGEIFRTNVIEKFGADYRILAFTLPGYTKTNLHQYGFPLLGWSFEEVVTAWIRTLNDLINESTIRRKPILIAHDWGCIVSNEFLMRKPRYFERIVMIDVAGKFAGDGEGGSCNLASLVWGKDLSMSFGKLFAIFVYQAWLIAVFLLGCVLPRLWSFFLPFMPKLTITRSVANWMQKKYAKISKAPKYTRNPEDNNDKDHEGVIPEMCWPYLQLWIHLFGRVVYPLPHIKHFREPVVPVLHGYGTKKPFQFHTHRWLKIILEKGRKDGISKSIPYVGGHWYWVRPDSATGAQFLKDLAAFLEA